MFFFSFFTFFFCILQPVGGNPYIQNLFNRVQPRSQALHVTRSGRIPGNELPMFIPEDDCQNVLRKVSENGNKFSEKCPKGINAQSTVWVSIHSFLGLNSTQIPYVKPTNAFCCLRFLILVVRYYLTAIVLFYIFYAINSRYLSTID